MEKLSIIDTEQKVNLENNKSDTLAIGMKSILGIVPFGSLVSEIVTNVIPNQRTERVVLFVEVLNEKFKYLEKEVVEQKVKTQEFTDLLQDGFIQASRALTDERLEYIASLLKNSLTDEELKHIEKKKLLSLLGELNDVEIIWLKRYSFDNVVGNMERQEFIEKHEGVLNPINLMEGEESHNEDQLNKKAFQENYLTNLSRLRLIRGTRVFGEVRTNLPLDEIEPDRYECSNLGKLLLSYIDLGEAEETE